MFGGLKGKLEKAKLKAEAAKAKLNTIEVQGTSGGVLVRVTGNREVRAVTIPEGMEREELQNHLITAMNNALQAANSVNEAEMAAVARETMPNIPGMGNLFGKQ